MEPLSDFMEFQNISENKTAVAVLTTQWESEESHVEETTEKIQDYCKSKELDLVEIFKIQNYGPKKGAVRRKKFQEVLKYIENKGIKALCFTDMNKDLYPYPAMLVSADELRLKTKLELHSVSQQALVA